MKTISKLTMIAVLATITSQAVAMDKVKTFAQNISKLIKPAPSAPKAPKPVQPWPMRPKGTIAGC